MTDDPLRDLARQQPGIATYPGTPGGGPVRPWIPLREITLRGDTEPTVQPATIAVEPPESPPPAGRTPDAPGGLSGPWEIPVDSPLHWDHAVADRLAPVLPERTCPAGHTGPLPEVPPETHPAWVVWAVLPRPVRWRRWFDRFRTNPKEH